MKGRHDLAGKAIDAYHFSNRCFNTEKLFPNGSPNHANVSRPIHVILREYCALIHVPTFDVEVFGRNAAVGGVPILIAVDNLNRIIHIRRNALDQRNLVLDCDGIGHNQRLRVMRACPDAVDRPAASFNPDEVFSQVVQLLLVSLLSRVADGHDTDDSCNPDGDPQHSQDASHLVSELRHQCGSKQSSVVHRSNASAASGRSYWFRIKLHHSWAIAPQGCAHFMLSPGDFGLSALALLRHSIETIYRYLPEGRMKEN